eukprot:7896727-Alexandrium_andersonii.AAC.1
MKRAPHAALELVQPTHQNCHASARRTPHSALTIATPRAWNQHVMRNAAPASAAARGHAQSGRNGASPAV